MLWLLGTVEWRVPTALKMTPKKMASGLQIPRHNLARFCCAKLCPSKFRLLLIPPPLRGTPSVIVAPPSPNPCQTFCLEPCSPPSPPSPRGPGTDGPGAA